MRPGTAVYVTTDDTPGRRAWAIGRVVRRNRVSVTVDVERIDGTSERVRVPVGWVSDTVDLTQQSAARPGRAR